MKYIILQVNRELDNQNFVAGTSFICMKRQS